MFIEIHVVFLLLLYANGIFWTEYFLAMDSRRPFGDITNMRSAAPTNMVMRRRMLCCRCAGGCFAAPASFVRWMLCRPCDSYSDGCFAVMLATCLSSSTVALPSWWCSGGCLATLMLLQYFSQRLGDGAFCVGLDAFCRLVWLGGLSGAPFFCGLCSASLQAACFSGLFYFFSIFSPLCTWVGQPLACCKKCL